MRWPSGLLASRTDVHTTACSAKVTYVVGIPTDPIHWQPPQPSGSRNGTPPKPNAPPSRYATGRIRVSRLHRAAHRCIAHHIRPWDDRGPTDLTNLVLMICHFHHRTVHHGTRHHPNPPPAASPPPPPAGHHHWRPVTGRMPDPTDRNHKPPVTGCARPKGCARHRGIQKAGTLRPLNRTLRCARVRPERDLRRTVAAGSAAEPAGAVTRKVRTTPSVLGRALLKSAHLIGADNVNPWPSRFPPESVRASVDRGRWRGCASRGGRAGRTGDRLLLGEDCVDQFHRSVSVGNQQFPQPRPHGPDGFEFPAGVGLEPVQPQSSNSACSCAIVVRSLASMAELTSLGGGTESLTTSGGKNHIDTFASTADSVRTHEHPRS